MADRGVDDAVVALDACLRGKDIASGITGRGVGIERRMTRCLAQVDEHARHARQHFAIFDNRVEVASVSKCLGQVVPDFGNTGFNRQRCIPCAAVRGVETHRLTWFGIGEAGIDEAGMGHAVNQFFGAECAKSAFLGNQPPAGRAFDLGEQRQLIGVVGQRREYGLAQPRAGHQPYGAGERLTHQWQRGLRLRARHAARRYTAGSRAYGECRLRSSRRPATLRRTPAPGWAGGASGRPSHRRTAGAGP